MAVFTASELEFSGRIDSKGRITVPSNVRGKLGLEKGDRVRLALQSGTVIRKEFSSKKEALEFLKGVEEVKSFSFDGEFLEVFVCE